LSKIRSEIHKFKPEDLEETIIEKSTTHSRTNGPTETPIGDQRGVSTFIFTNETYRILLGISQTMFMTNSVNISLKQCSCVISQMNNGIT
jgi:hypothetical protein